MYRLKAHEEAFELGIEDAFYDGVNLVEWPEKIASILPKNIWKITINVEGGVRVFRVECFVEEKKKRLEQIVYE
jgi:tRNA A37 threonylcarbamoyladenosine biosynthesis protein TsaE